MQQRINGFSGLVLTVTVLIMAGCGGGDSKETIGGSAPTPVASTSSVSAPASGTSEAPAVPLAEATVLTFSEPVGATVINGACPIPSADFSEPVAKVWTHPNGSLLFIGFGENQPINVRRYELIHHGDQTAPLQLTEMGNGPVLGSASELLVDPDDPRIIYALVDRTNLWISRDAGLTFSYETEVQFGDSVEDIAVTGGDSGHLWAVTSEGIFRAQKSTQESGSPGFERVQAFSQILLSGDYSIAVHPDRPQRLLVTGADGTYRSDDAGDSWRLVADAPTPRLIVDPHDPDRIYGSAQTSVYLSEDFGESWEHVGFFGFLNDLLVADPFRAGRLYIGPWEPGMGLWASDDEGREFVRIDDLPENVRSLAFTADGALFVDQGNRVVCLPRYPGAELDPDHSLGVDLAIEDTDGAYVAQMPVQTAVQARISVNNRTGSPIAGVHVEAWLQGPSGRVIVYSEPGVEIGSGGWEQVLDLPAPRYEGTYRLFVSADPANEAAAGALGYFAATREAPEPGPYVDTADLEVSSLWLNYAHPWFPIVTEAGEQRRMVLDVDNYGPDTARNVVVQIYTGSLLRVDDYSPVYAGQRLDCSEDASALTCSLGDIPVGDTVYIELYVTPLRAEVTGVPVTVSSDTPERAANIGGLDLVSQVEGPSTFEPGTVLEYAVTVTNIGDAMAQSNRVHGAIGPWPAMTTGHRINIDSPDCDLAGQTGRDDEPLEYVCSVWFLEPGESHRFTIQVAAPESAYLAHVVEAFGYPDNSSNFTMELFRGNNARGLVSIPMP